MSAGLIVKFFSVLFLVLTYVLYKPPLEAKPEQIMVTDPNGSIVSFTNHVVML